jgi:hypothetical protein
VNKVHEQAVETDDFDVLDVAENFLRQFDPFGKRKSGRLDGLSAIARISLSNRLAARRTRSSWPRVIGSKVPG